LLFALNEEVIMRALVASLLALGLVSTTGSAQTRDTSKVHRTKRDAEQRRRVVDYIDAAQLSKHAAYLAKRHFVGTTILTSADLQTTFLLVRRATSSQPEVHARWDDVVMVRAGTGAIEMGDSLVGSTYRAPGERVGGKLTKRYQIVVHAGDIVRIPAAVPHVFVVSGAEPLEYLVIKQRRQELPIRWFGEP
jgi:mannose-6-phosphate isomerase-like protein (cupin superfamily)